MTREELGTRVRAIISDHLTRFRRDVEVTDECKLLDGGLKLDSLDLVEIAMELEDQLDTEIPDDEIDAVSTVAELTIYLAGKLGIVEAVDPDADICSVCAKPIPPSSPVRYYDDIGEVHAICGGATPEQAVGGGRIPVDPDEFGGEGPPPEFVTVYLSGAPRAGAA